METHNQELSCEHDKLISCLENIIEQELQKEPGEIDENLVDECLAFIMELKDISCDRSEDELQQQIQSIVSSTNIKEIQTAKKPHKVVRFRVVLVAAMVAILLIGSCVTAYAVSPEFRNWIREVITLPFGGQIHDSQMNITYKHLDVKKQYSDIQSLVEGESLNILYPAKLPDKVQVTNVLVLNENVDEQILIAFEPHTYSILILSGQQNNSMPDGELFVHDGITYHIVQEENGAFAFFNHAGHYYSIQAPDYQSLINILENLKG